MFLSTKRLSDCVSITICVTLIPSQNHSGWLILRTLKSATPHVRPTERRPGCSPPTWFSGVVREYSNTTEKHLVQYRDGETRWHSLQDEFDGGNLRW